MSMATMSFTTVLKKLYPILAGVAVLLLVALIRTLLITRIPKGLKLPPGPPGFPLIGNLLDMPAEQEWITFSNWAKTYGDIVYLKVPRQDIIILNTWDLTYELFEKRSSFYSDRCDFPMLRDLVGMTWNMAFMPYGDFWRRHRRLAHRSLHPAASAQHQPVQLRHTRTMIQRFQEDPKQYLEHIRHSAGAAIMEIVYGIKVLPKDDPYVDIAERGMAALGLVGNAGAYLVDTLPILKYVPPWFPGAGFRRQAQIWRKAVVAMKDMPFEAVKSALKSGTAEVSITSVLLEDMARQKELPVDEEEVIQNTVTTLFAGGSDTTVTALHSFMLAMVLYPEAQKRAQKELDEVLGNRLPEFEDRESLPFVDAMAKEVTRWHPVVPLGVIHRVTHDDVVGEYFIPKGTIIFGNAWHILHDPSVYGPDPEKFAPERFLAPGVKEPTIAFGYGRRLCPGRFVADSSVFISIASLLKVFNISPIKDANGKEQPLEAKFVSGFFSSPELFECDIRPRSAAAEKLIQQADTL